jgi:Fur family peroxide stress response transcriptional regulator
MTIESMDRQERIKTVTAKLAAAGHRISPQRAFILKSLMMAPSHPSAEEIYSVVLEKFPNASLATVYKTIDALKEIDEIRLVTIAAGRGHYDAVNPTNHPHVVCTKCGRTEDVTIDFLPSQAQVAAVRSGFSILEERVQFLGLCPTCLPDAR